MEAEGQMMTDYVMAAFQQIMPLLKECYAEGRARVPTLAGKVMIDLMIEGQPGLGGVVGESNLLAEGTTLTDPTVQQCIQETVYALEIDPPTYGVRHRFTTSLVFADEEPKPGIDSAQIIGPE